MFDDISGGYDLINRVMSFGLDRFLRRLCVGPHHSDALVLDICSGTGEMSAELLRSNSFSGRIVMADFSLPMHRLAKAKMRRLGEHQAGRIFYVCCDAENLPFRAGVFDGVINGFSLRNLGDLRAFSSELFRTLKIHGRCSLVDLAHPPSPLFGRIFYLYFYRLVPLLSRLFTVKKYAYRYLPASLRSFFKQEEVLKRLCHVGFTGTFENRLRGAVAVYRLTKSP